MLKLDNQPRAFLENLPRSTIHGSRLQNNQSRTSYRSFRYSSNREQNVRTADASSLPKFRIKKNSILQSTMYKTGFNEDNISKTIDVNNYQNNDYLKTFHSLINSEKKMNQQDKRNWQVKPMKFKIQNFKEIDISQFTLLDPFQRHLKSIQTQSKKVQQILYNQNLQVKVINGELKNLKSRCLASLNQISQGSLNQLQKLRKFLKQNSTRQQQTKLKYKQQIASLQLLHEQNIKKFNKIMGNNKSLQQTIFDCQPFQLISNQQDLDHQYDLNKLNGMMC